MKMVKNRPGHPPNLRRREETHLKITCIVSTLSKNVGGYIRQYMLWKAWLSQICCLLFLISYILPGCISMKMLYNARVYFYEDVIKQQQVMDALCPSLLAPDQDDAPSYSRRLEQSGERLACWDQV